MKIAAPYSKHLSKRFKVTLMVSAIISILFLFCRFMPHGFVYPIEVRNNVLAWFTGETFCLINLFVCLSCLMIMVMRYDNNWLSGAAMLFFPFLLVPVALLTLLSLIMPPYRWIDDKIFQSGDEYLIYQINPGREMDLTRTIKTNSPDAPIRYIWQAPDLNIAVDSIPGNIVLYEGKTWIKQAVKK